MDNSSGDSGWEQLFRLVFERTSNPVILLDGERRILDANPAAVALWGGAREDLLGTSMVDGIEPSERARAERDWREFQRSGEFSGSRILVLADGSEVQVDFAARLATVAGKRVAIYVMIARDGEAFSAASRLSELPLTGREREIVTLIVMGQGTRQIAAGLHISVATVRTHIRNAMGKLGVHTRAQLVAQVLCAEDLVHPEIVRDT